MRRWRSAGSHARVLLKLLQHLLIWLAASIVIVLGASWGYALGFTSHRAGPQLLAWTIATATVIFAGALVQRAPAAIVVLVGTCAAVCLFGIWLMIGGAFTTGVIYVIAGAAYIFFLGPSCLRWISKGGMRFRRSGAPKFRVPGRQRSGVHVHRSTFFVPFFVLSSSFFVLNAFQRPLCLPSSPIARR